MMRRKKNPSTLMDRSQRTLAVQDKVVLRVGELGAGVQGLGEPRIEDLLRKEQQDQKEG